MNKIFNPQFGAFLGILGLVTFGLAEFNASFTLFNTSYSLWFLCLLGVLSGENASVIRITNVAGLLVSFMLLFLMGLFLYLWWSWHTILPWFGLIPLAFSTASLILLIVGLILYNVFATKDLFYKGLPL